MSNATYQKGSRGNPNTGGNGAISTVLDPRVDNAKKRLEAMKSEITKVGGKYVDPEELVRFTLNACIKNPKLWDCFASVQGTASVFLSIITSRIIGIPCDGIHGYLVPFRDNKADAMICQYMPGYKGFVQLALQSNAVATFNAQPVFKGDFFEFEYGSSQFLRHRPSEGVERNEENLTHAYAIYQSTKGGSDFRVLFKSDIEKRRLVSKSKDDGPWKTWYAEQATKTAILALAKVAPLGQKVNLAAKVADHIETHGMLTANDVTSLRESAQPIAIGHTATGYDVGAIRDLQFEGEQEQPELEPASRTSGKRQEQRPDDHEPRVTMDSMIQEINAANSLNITSLQERITREQEAGTFGQSEVDELFARIQERRNSLKR